MLETKLPVKDLPVGIRHVLTAVGYTSKLITVRGENTRTTIACGYSSYKISFAALVPDLHNVADALGLAPVIHRGAFGGNNGFNKPRGPWDPDHDTEAKEIPADGAIVDGYPDHATVNVTPATFATLIVSMTDPRPLALTQEQCDTIAHEASVAGDAAIDGRQGDALALAQRVLDASLPTMTEHEQAIIYAYVGLKSCDTRKAIVAACPEARLTLASRGFLRISSNGATTATNAATQYYASKRHDCETQGMRITSPWLYRMRTEVAS